jgi:hypothetical protein
VRLRFGTRCVASHFCLNSNLPTVGLLSWIYGPPGAQKQRQRWDTETTMHRGQPVRGVSLLLLAVGWPAIEATDPSRDARLGLDGFVQECHDALEKGRLTKEKFSDFISRYCHDRPGPSCSDSISFASLPLDPGPSNVVCEWCLLSRRTSGLLGWFAGERELF